MNDDLQVEKLENYLENKKIALCITGGIATIEAPKIARHLRRYGADVTIYATDSALKFIGKPALEWGSGKESITQLSGLAEHICSEDLVIIAPATINTINKIFSGIADNPVTTLVASALGKNIPIIIAPTMHMSLYNNPFLKNNLKSNLYSKYKIKIIEPRFEEGKAKIPKIDIIVAEASRELSNHAIKDKRILVTGGSTPGKIDDVRFITNKFKGTLAVEIAKEAHHRGAIVKLLINKTGVEIPSYLDVIYHKDYDEYYENVIKYSDPNTTDAAILTAAVADYLPEYTPGKIPSGKLTSISLKQTKKVIEEIRKKYPLLFMVTFKHEAKLTKEELLEIAQKRINQGYQIVVANRDEDINENHKAYIVSKNGVISEPESKKEIAKDIINILSKSI